MSVDAVVFVPGICGSVLKEGDTTVRPGTPANAVFQTYPTPNGLVGESHTTFGQQILDVARAQREPEVVPIRLLNDLGREPVTRLADFLHPLGYRAASGPASATLRDNARRLFRKKLQFPRSASKSSTSRKLSANRR